MGNCIGSSFALSNNDRKVSPSEERVERKTLAVVDWGAPLSLAEMLKSGEDCQLTPQANFEKLPHVPESCNGQRVKIVVNRKQLQALMKMQQELKVRHIVLMSKARKGRKWRPSLATIPEL